MAQTKMRVKCGVSVPMDTDGISPDSLAAAFSMGAHTLLDRSAAAGDALDWSTIEVALQPGTDGATMMIIRAAKQ